jgi:hypothetical protein
MYYSNRHLLGEFTFGEYWNLAGCNAAVAKIENIASLCQTFEADHEKIKFVYEGLYSGDGSFYSISVPLKSKAVVSENKVKTKDSSGHEIKIEFYELAPSRNPVEIQKDKE